MKKIPTLFERVFENHKKVDILPNITPGMEWFLEGKGVATVKYDGSCCAIIDGKLYKRYDAKHGKKAPEGAIPCCEPDPITGHHPHWVEVNPNDPADRWFIAAYEATPKTEIHDGTYEAVGLHFNGNKYNLDKDILIRHGEDMLEVEHTFEGVKKFLAENNIEGLVFWKDGEPACKIKRSDFGFSWPCLTDDTVFSLLKDKAAFYLRFPTAEAKENFLKSESITTPDSQENDEAYPEIKMY